MSLRALGRRILAAVARWLGWLSRALGALAGPGERETPESTDRVLPPEHWLERTRVRPPEDWLAKVRKGAPELLPEARPGASKHRESSAPQRSLPSLREVREVVWRAVFAERRVRADSEPAPTDSPAVDSPAVDSSAFADVDVEPQAARPANRRPVTGSPARRAQRNTDGPSRVQPQDRRVVPRSELSDLMARGSDSAALPAELRSVPIRDGRRASRPIQDVDELRRGSSSDAAHDVRSSGRVAAERPREDFGVPARSRTWPAWDHAWSAWPDSADPAPKPTPGSDDRSDPWPALPDSDYPSDVHAERHAEIERLGSLDAEQRGQRWNA
jgi:hypothetical protein